MKRAPLILAALTLLLDGVGQANGGFLGVAGGSGNPEPTLGPYTMTSFTPDFEPYQRPAGRQINSLASPLEGTLGFNANVTIYPTSVLSAYWTNSYTADVYNYPNATGVVDLVLTLPSNTVAFYLYIELDSYAAPDPITVTAQDGTSITQTIQDNITGPEYFGFYTTGGDVLTTLTISVAQSNLGYGDIFLGEFGIASGPAGSPSPAPEPSSLVLLGSGIACMAGYRWRRRKLAAA